VPPAVPRGPAGTGRTDRGALGPRGPAAGGSRPPASPLDDSITAAESDAPARRLVSFNEYEGPLGSIRIGGGVLYDYAAFSQDASSREQVELDSQWKYRDGRVLLSGRLNFKRPTTWSAGIMFDGAKKEWVVRQTGIMVAVPELWGHIFVGRSKEGSAGSTKMTGLEAYYRPGPFTFGSEYFLQRVDAPASGDPLFHGGDAVATWLITGETRTYNTRGGYFNQISPKRPAFAGGPGAWEVVAHFSNVDLDGGAITGGKFWRFTPMLNWYVSDHVRLAFVYGYGSLDRFGLVGKTRFFQTRLQLQL
jgi:hypothetical protein